MLPLRKIFVARSELRAFCVPVTHTIQNKYLEHDADTRTTTIEGFQGTLKTVPLQDARKALEIAVDYSVHGPSVQGIQGGHDDLLDDLQITQPVEEVNSVPAENIDAFKCHNNLSLHGCMQTNVPEPFYTDVEHYVSDHNFPGSGHLLLQKYISDAVSDFHPARKYHTSSHHYRQSALTKEYEESPNPQGIQGDECTLKLWMENCMRYNLPDCDEQLKNIKEGRKTLSQVFAEQDLMIKRIAESYKSAQAKDAYARLNLKTVEADTPCPQGIQGDDCVRFQLWLQNCQRFSLSECQEQLNGIRSGRKTLAQVFAEQDAHIRRIVTDHYQKRRYSTSSNKDKSEVGRDVKSQSNPEILSQKDRLKRAIKEYGSTVIVFHVGISLISLGGFYLAVSSGIDMVSILKSLGVGESILQSKITTGASTFVVAYAVHKVFAPVRIAITLTSVPLIVRYLRRIGFLKPPKPSS